MGGLVDDENINRKIKVSFTRFVSEDFLAPNSLALVIMLSLTLLECEGHTFNREFILLLSGRQRVRVSLCLLFLKCFYFKVINTTK